MRCRSLTILTLVSTAAFGQAFHFVRHEIREPGKERIAGAAFDGQRLVTWGDRILTWDLPGGRIQPMGVRLPSRLGAGGALFVDGLVLNQAGGRRALFWINLRTGKIAEIDHGVSANEILPATIQGRRGLIQ